MSKPAEMSKAMAEAIDGRVIRANPRSTGPTSKAVGKPVPSVAGEKPVKPPIRPVTGIIRLVGVTRRDAAIARLIERAGGAGVSSRRRLDRGRRRAAKHYRRVVITRGGYGCLAASADHERGRTPNGRGRGRSGEARSSQPRGDDDAAYQRQQRSTKQNDAHHPRLALSLRSPRRIAI